MRSLGAASALLLTLLWTLSTGCVSVDLFGARRGDLQERVLSGSAGPKLLLIDIQGELSESEGTGLLAPARESTTARLSEILAHARRDDQVRGLLLRIDSPGGTATSSEIVYSELVRFKRERQVPIVAQFMGVAASGAYYAAMSADEIRAHPTSVCGSIGVIYLGVSLAGLMDELGIENQTLTTGPYKDAGSPLRRMRPEERRQLQSVLDDLQSRFREVVARGRPELDPQQLAAVSDGRIFSASQALELGLVDAIGTLQEAVDRLEERAALTESRVVTYHRRREWRRTLYTETGSPVPLLDLGSLFGSLRRPGFHYLWWPGIE